MSRIGKMNFWGIALTVTAVAASSALLMGCGQPPSPRPVGTVPGASTNPTGPITIANGAQSATVSQFPQAEIAGLLKTYSSWQIRYVDDDDNTQSKDATISLVAATANGQQTIQISLTVPGTNLRFQDTISGINRIPPSYNAGATYTLFTHAVTSTLDQGEPVEFYMQLVLNASNQVIPESSKIRIVDAWSSQFQDDSNDPVQFILK
jgi:hypothetical protein